MLKPIYLLIICVVLNITLFSQKIIVGSKINPLITVSSISNKPFLLKDLPPNSFYVFCVVDSFNNQLSDSLIKIKRLGKSISSVCILNTMPDKVLFKTTLTRLDSLGIILFVDKDREFYRSLSSKKLPQYFIVDNSFSVLQQPNNISNIYYYFNRYYLINNNLVDKVL